MLTVEVRLKVLVGQDPIKEIFQGRAQLPVDEARFQATDPQDLPGERDDVIDDHLLDPAVGLDLGAHVVAQF
jgi:hypothetical protein